MTAETDWSPTVAQARRVYGGLDILVNNAGFAVMKPIESLSLEDVRFELAINFESCFLGTKHGLAALSDSGGVILNTASVASIKGGLMSTAYAPSKAAMLAFTRAAALEARRDGGRVRVNAILPGFIWGSQVARFGEERANALRTATIARTPLGRVGEPTDVASMAVYLASDAAKAITGAALFVDGGIGL